MPSSTASNVRLGRHRRRRDNIAARTLGRRSELGYRYCWLRDATFTLLAFMSLGYYDEARAWRDWLTRAIAGSPRQVQIMYGVGGERWLPELIIPWLPGYEQSARG
jgi:GH15 family glucan-1,4-alpha-glucosidase